MNDVTRIEPAEGYIAVEDGRIHFLDWGGTGPYAHFLHANGFCAGTYAPFISYLTAEYHILASDVRGHGDSNLPSHQRIRNWRIFADDLNLVVEHTMPPPIIGMGHSLGAVTTYIAASIYPHLFSCIILLDPVVLPPRILWLIAAMKLLGLRGNLPLAKKARRRRRLFSGKLEALKRFTAGRGIFKTWSKEFIEAYLECGLLEEDGDTAILKCDPELEAQIFESVPLDIWNYARKITCPVLAIRGEKSDVFSYESADRLKTAIPDCEFETIMGAGHFVPMEKPHECARMIKDFVSRKTIRLV